MRKTTIRGCTALVTGAAKRIGREIAVTLAHEGVNIIVHYSKSEDTATQLTRELMNLGVKSWSVRADFTARSEYEGLIQRAQEISGKLDILVNNASIFPMDDLRSLNFASLITNLEVNAWAPFVLCREFANRVDRGKIVNLLDSRTTGYDWSHVGYILSKHVLTVLTQMSALEYAPRISVNGIAPGLILPPPGKSLNYLEERVNTVPLRRHGDPADVAEAVVYLLKAPFVTGTVVYVDGGRHLKEYAHG